MFKTNENIVLRENDELITKPDLISEIFNEYFCNVAMDIGSQDFLTQDDNISSICDSYMNHLSVKLINDNVQIINEFTFTQLSQEDILTLLSKIDPKKAIGFDGIPTKLIKIASNEIAGPITQFSECLISS